MQQITLYFWRVQDPRNGKWYTTRHRATEADIRRDHPEAECMPGESLTLPLPETPADVAQRLRMECIHYPATPGVCRSGGVTGDEAALQTPSHLLLADAHPNKEAPWAAGTQPVSPADGRPSMLS